MTRRSPVALMRRHPVAVVLLVVALAGLIWFAAGLIGDAHRIRGPRPTQPDLQGWMSPRFVGKTWDLPPDTIVAVMELEPDHKQHTLDDVTRHLGITMADLQARVEAAKAAQMAQHRERGDPPPPTAADVAPGTAPALPAKSTDD